jgi:hypothetical protein
MELFPHSVLSGCLAALAGLATLLRSRAPLTVRSILAATLATGLMGWCITVLWLWRFPQDIWPATAMSVLIGMANVRAREVLRFILRGVGESIDGKKQ